MTTAVVVLMLITSSGAFGYLSAAFQQALQPNKELAVQVDSVKRELAILQPEKQSLTASKERIDVQIANLPNESVRGRQRLMASFKPEQDRINSRANHTTAYPRDRYTQAQCTYRSNHLCS